MIEQEQDISIVSRIKSIVMNWCLTHYIYKANLVYLQKHDNKSVMAVDLAAAESPNGREMDKGLSRIHNSPSALTAA